MIVDTHIHLSHHLYNDTFSFLSFQDDEYLVQSGTCEDMIRKMQESGLVACIDPGIDIESNSKILCFAKQYPSFIFPAIGIHPTRTFQYRTVDINGKVTNVRLHWKQRDAIRKYADDPQVVAIGETGLDYHLERSDQHRLRQKLWFIWQIRLAHKKQLPLILHIRDADEDAIRILSRFQHYLHGGVCHCFSGNIETAKEYIELGFKLGIGGALLKESPRKRTLEQAVIQIPLEHILLETDGPYVKPDLHNMTKKKAIKVRNSSLILPAVIDRIAELKGIAVDEVEHVTTDNARQLFNLDLR